MYGKTLDFYQIFYKEEQRNQLYDFAIPFFNQGVSPYLENSIIKLLVPKSTADFISVSSWKLKQKRSSMPSIHVLGSSKLSEERILSFEFDAAILTPRLPGHKTLFMSQHWHGKTWADSFSELRAFLEGDLGIEVPNELRFAIYENHFIAKRQIYHDYVFSCLIPVLEFMAKTSAFNQHSGYRSHKERLGDFESVLDYERSTGLVDWPIGVFLLERLFSIWINDKQLNVINL